jgi:hypothetical protein
VGHLIENLLKKSNAPPMPDPPPLGLNIDVWLYYKVSMVGIFIHWYFKHRWRAMCSFLVYVFLPAKCCWSWQAAKLTYEWYDPNIGYAS